MQCCFSKTSYLKANINSGHERNKPIICDLAFSKNTCVFESSYKPSKNQQLKVKYKPNKHEASLQCMIKINKSNVTYAMLLLRESLI